MIRLPNRTIRTTKNVTPADRRQVLAWLRKHHPGMGYTVAFFDGFGIDPAKKETFRVLTVEATARVTIVPEPQEKLTLVVREWGRKASNG